jgi:hypothetical protein
VNPSDVRARVLAEHLWLCEKLTQVEEAARSVLAGSQREARRLRAGVQDLCESLRIHLATEDELLVPLLHDLDAWGEIRAERVRSDHQAQRGELEALCREAEENDSATLAASVLAFGKALRADMALEETVSLGPDLLRDDTISADQLDA